MTSDNFPFINDDTLEMIGPEDIDSLSHDSDLPETERISILANLLTESVVTLHAVSEEAMEYADAVEELASNNAQLESDIRNQQNFIDAYSQEISVAVQAKLWDSGVQARLHKENETLREEASRDHLTGLFNRKIWDREMERLMQDSSKEFGILFIDVDNLKNINAVGYTIGDDVLRRSAQAIVDELRDADIATPARIGGDEFAVLCDLTPSPTEGPQEERRTQAETLTARERLEKICGRLSNALDTMIDTEFSELRMYGVGFSIGGSVRKEGMAAHELITSAEEEMKEDKAFHKFKLLSPEQKDKPRTSEAVEIINILKLLVRIPEIN